MCYILHPITSVTSWVTSSLFVCKRLLYCTHWMNLSFPDEWKKKRNADVGYGFTRFHCFKTRFINFFGATLGLRLSIYVFSLLMLDEYFRNKRSYKINLLQNKKHCLVQSQTPRSLWVRAQTRTQWLPHQTVAGWGPLLVSESLVGTAGETVVRRVM